MAKSALRAAAEGEFCDVLQEVVTNLMISHIEVRGEADADVAAYRHATAREVRVVRPSRDVDAARSVLMHSFRRVMDQLAHSKVRSAVMPWHVTWIDCLER